MVRQVLKGLSTMRVLSRLAAERLVTMRIKLLVFCLLMLCVTVPLSAREITDMTGRRLVVPDRINRVFASSPPATYMLYALDPTLLVGSNFNARDYERRFLRPEFLKLPVAGGIYGQGKTVNYEALLVLKPEVVLRWSSWGTKADEQFSERMQKAGIPTVSIRLEQLDESAAAFRFLGELLNRRERAQALAAYADETMRSVARIVAQIPPKERLRVYYAEGPDGLSTEGSNSWHAQLIPLAGGRNVHVGKQLEQTGMEKISMEQVIMYDPEVILTHDRTFFAALYKDRRWQALKAVKNGRVLLIPTLPFNWFDRPPSFMRLIGLQWLTHQLYPRRYPVQIVQETKRFYRLFLGVSLTDRDVREILQR